MKLLLGIRGGPWYWGDEEKGQVELRDVSEQWISFPREFSQARHRIQEQKKLRRRVIGKPNFDLSQAHFVSSPLLLRSFKFPKLVLAAE